MTTMAAIILNVVAIAANVFAFILHTMAGNILGAGIALVLIALNVACIIALNEYGK